jgi:ribosomal protein S13
MNKLRHNKYRNTGILFELLVRKITADTMSNQDSKAVSLIKKYFVNTELSKENKLYQSISKIQNISEAKAESIISTILEINKSLNQVKLSKEKYNLIKEIKSNFDIDDFFKAKISNYKLLSSTYTLLEANLFPSHHIDTIIMSKMNILEQVAQSQLIKEIQPTVSEFETLDKGTRALVYKIMLEKFNTRFETLSNDQKDVLKEYINNITNTTNLKKYVDTKFTSLKESLIKFLPKIEDATIKIKVNETINLINPILESKTVKDDNIVALLQYQELHNELKKIHNGKR